MMTKVSTGGVGALWEGAFGALSAQFQPILTRLLHVLAPVAQFELVCPVLFG